MSDVIVPSFLTKKPPLAARVWSPADASVRRHFIVYGDGSVIAQDRRALEEALFVELFLPSGGVLRAFIEKDTHPAEFIKKALDEFVAARGVPALYGIAPSSDAKDLEAIFIPAAPTTAAIDVKALSIHGESYAVGYRIEGKRARVRVLVEEDEAYVSAVTAPLLEAPHQRGHVDVIPVRRSDGRRGVELVHAPVLAASFFRYLDVDAVEAASIVGRAILDQFFQQYGNPTPSGGDVLAASVFVLRFGGEGDALKLVRVIERLSQRSEYNAFISDFTLAGELLRFSAGEQREDFPLRTLNAFNDQNLPASTWLVVYANRFLTDFVLDRGERPKWREQMTRLAQWSDRLELRRPFPSYAGGAPSGPAEIPSPDATERHEQIAAAKKKSEGDR